MRRLVQTSIKHQNQNEFRIEGAHDFQFSTRRTPPYGSTSTGRKTKEDQSKATRSPQFIRYTITYHWRQGQVDTWHCRPRRPRRLHPTFAFTILVLPPLHTGALRGATPADNHAPKGKLVICKHSRPLALNQLFTVFDAAYSEEEGISLSR